MKKSSHQTKNLAIAVVIVLALALPLVTLPSRNSPFIPVVTQNTAGWVISPSEAKQLVSSIGASLKFPIYMPSGLQLQYVLVVQGSLLNGTDGEIALLYSGVAPTNASDISKNVWSSILDREVAYVEIVGSSTMGQAYQLEIDVSPPDGAWSTSQTAAQAQSIIDTRIDADAAETNSTFMSSGLASAWRTQLDGAPAEVRIQQQGSVTAPSGETNFFLYSGVHIDIFDSSRTYSIRSTLSLNETLMLAGSLEE